MKNKEEITDEPLIVTSDIIDTLKTKYESEINEYKDKYLRTLAEHENYKKRSEKSNADLSIRSKIELFNIMRPLFDNVIRYTENGHDEMLYKSMIQCLNDAGFTKYGEIGDIFDCDEYESIGVTETGNVESGCVNQIYSSGWKYKDGTIASYCKVFVEV